MRTLAAALALALLTCWSFGAVARHPFVDWDDGEYVVDNARVRAGLTPEGFAWAFSTSAAANYHPLTWLSHMLDVELFGLKPGAHHLTSLALHVANVVLLFLVLRAATARPWPSALAAGLFAVHPLHVESVAWVAERKDVLSGLFAMLALLLHVRAARRPSALRRAAVLAAFTLGLLAKSMLVTLPLVLLLLDYWPLGRFAHPGGGGSRWRPILEKAPLLAVAALFGGVAVLTQSHGGAVTRLDVVPLGQRAGHALVAYVLYLGKTISPVGLSFLYPYPSQPRPASQVLAAAALLVLGTVLAVGQKKRRPYLLVGWLWFLVGLLPVIGIVQVGVQLMADRYTYLPLVGLFCAAAWAGAGLAGAFGRRAAAVGGVGAVALLAPLAVLARDQVAHWRDDVALFGHAVEVDPDNWLAHNNLGRALARRGSDAEAARHFEEALRANPRYAAAWCNLGLTRRAQGRPDEAERLFRTALGLSPEYADAHVGLGASLLQLGRVREAIPHLEAAARLNPRDPIPPRNLGLAWDLLGDPDRAERSYREALRLKPDYAAAAVGLEQVTRRRRADGQLR